MLGSDLDRLEQEVLHTFIDELLLGLVDLHAAVTGLVSATTVRGDSGVTASVDLRIERVRRRIGVWFV